MILRGTTGDYGPRPAGGDERKVAFARQYRLVGVAGAEHRGNARGHHDILVAGQHDRHSVVLLNEFTGLSGRECRRDLDRTEAAIHRYDAARLDTVRYRGSNHRRDVRVRG